MSVLEGKVAIVTGGAQGIGRAIAHGLAANGTRIVVADLHDDRGREGASGGGREAARRLDRRADDPARDQLPEDVVGAVVFFCGPGSDFVTGQTIVIDGGQYFH